MGARPSSRRSITPSRMWPTCSWLFPTSISTKGITYVQITHVCLIVDWCILIRSVCLTGIPAKWEFAISVTVVDSTKLALGRYDCVHSHSKNMRVAMQCTGSVVNCCVPSTGKVSLLWNRPFKRLITKTSYYVFWNELILICVAIQCHTIFVIHCLHCVQRIQRFRKDFTKRKTTKPIGKQL